MNPLVRFHNITPQFVVHDVVKTAEYYRDILGFTIIDYFLDPPVYAMVERGGLQIHFGKADTAEIKTNAAFRKITFDAYIWVTGIEQLFSGLKEKKADIVEGIVTRIYGNREFVVRDCNGFLLTFGEQ